MNQEKPIVVVPYWTERGPGFQYRTWVKLAEPLPPVFDPERRA